MNVRFALFGKVKIKVKAKRCGHIVHITEHVLIPAAKIHILSNPPNKNGLFSQKNGVFSVFLLQIRHSPSLFPALTKTVIREIK